MPSTYRKLSVFARDIIAEKPAEKTGVKSTLGIAPKTADFVSEAATSDMFEIQLSKLARERFDDATKKFAAKMIADHEKVSSEMKSLAEAAHIALPTALDCQFAANRLPLFASKALPPEVGSMVGEERPGGAGSDCAAGALSASMLAAARLIRRDF